MFIRRQFYCWLSILFLILAGCTASTKFWPETNFVGDKITTQNVIRLKMDVQGDINNSSSDVFSSFLLGFKKQNDSISLINVNSNDKGYYDLELLLNLTAKSSLSGGDYIKTLPLVGGLYGESIDFNWKSNIHYNFKNTDGELLYEGSFQVNGLDIYFPTKLEAPSVVLGIGAIVARYPSTKQQEVVSHSMMQVVGEEMAKRLSVKSVKSYLAAREKQRDGMDIKTYVEFIEQKKRLEKERELAKAQRVKEMDVSIKNVNTIADIKSGTVMVLGIGVSKYLNDSQIPNLKYADRDSQRVVEFFKNKYNLSNDRAMLLTNEDATAIKISRFITNNAMKLLDKNDTFILYFGGHGAPDVDASSSEDDGLKKYLLLHDSDLNALPMTALSLNNLATLLERLPCKRVVILLDSCFAGAAGVKTLAKLKSLRVSDKSYKNISQLSGEGRVILAASSENQVSHEEDSLQAGVFTHYLLEGLSGKADAKGEGQINILGLYDYVTKGVSGYTGKKQTPVFRGTLDANIIF